MKKHRLGITCILATSIMIFAFLNPVHANSSFKDMERFGWAKNTVDYLVEKGAINGVGDNLFAPHKELTRGEAAKIIALILELDVNMNEKTNLVDGANHWASPYIKAIQTEKPGVIDGYPDGTFKPNRFVTREEMTKMIVLAYNFERNTSRSLQFDDVSGWATDYIEILASLGIIYGNGDGRFAPKAHVNRAQAASMIHLANEVFPITLNPEFNVEKTVERDGIKFDLFLGQAYGRLYVKTKATNISENGVPYIGFNGCDRGFSANLFTENNGEKIEVGSVWRNPVILCTQAIQDLVLEPGETIEETEILNPPTEGFKENHFVKVEFQKGVYEGNSTIIPIEIEIPLEELE
ncbi:S-layer homology domain-containing protein [Lysinibacillus yapensis]|uniref:S-layer homology domain-containing protein n=1 Tax=Ureibacillus yapensis TaxID=2304605 RepID=A0A396S2J3_9BACL|nr:S-layer homology domain-containing protein [Lysinibacillus yapensis]RHW31377.1 S-layer homology domain-containing protein [Lysinibacillus yapensis]